MNLTDELEEKYNKAIEIGHKNADVFVVFPEEDILRDYYINTEGNDCNGILEETVIYDLSDFIKDCDSNNKDIIEEIRDNGRMYEYDLDGEDADISSFLKDYENGLAEKNGCLTMYNADSSPYNIDVSQSRRLMDFCKKELGEKNKVKSDFER